MAYFVLEYQYADLEARARTRQSHLAYLGGLHAEGRVVLGGPLADTSGAVVVYRADSAEEAQALVDADPYTAASVGTGHTLREWNIVVG